MAVTRLNHAVLYVRDLDASTRFYTQVLGFEVIRALPGAAFLRAGGSTNDHDLGLFALGARAADSGAGRSTVGLYHLAWEVETLDELAALQVRLAREGALVGATDHGTTKSLYARDPDGLELELVWLVPAALLTDDAVQAATRLAPLDLDREVTRYGGSTRGGLGVSIPLGVTA